MRHGDQLKLAVVDAENVVAVKIEAQHIAVNLRIACCVTETQVAVCWLQCLQVAGDAVTVAGAKGADGHMQARGASQGLGAF